MKVNPMTLDELTDYFNEHVLYELLMLRYTRSELEPKGPEGPGVPQLHWNAMFAAFNVSARNLYDFLNGDDKTNVRVVDYRVYCRSFSLGSMDAIRTTKEMLHPQCLHMGRGRSNITKDKINLDRVKTMSDWLEKEMKSLIGSFDMEFRSKIIVERADPKHTVNVVVQPGITGPLAPIRLDITTNPSTTNHTVLVQTNTVEEP